MSSKPYDQAFKYLAEQDAESLLILLGHLRLGEKAEIEVLPRELSASTLLPDQPYLVKTRQGETIAHVEAQTQWNDNVPERMADYGARLWMNYHLPIKSYVLLLTRKGLPKKVSNPGIIKAGDIEITAHFNLVRLWTLSAEQVLAMKRESLLPFVPLMKGGKRELEISARFLRDVKDERKQRDLGIHFMMLGGLRYNREDLLELIVERGMIPLEQLRESSFYQFILEEGEKIGEKIGEKRGEKIGEKIGEKRGKKIGEKRGEKIGQLKGMLGLLNSFIEKRFPTLNVAADLNRIDDPVVLHQLSVEAWDMQDAQAFKRRLTEILQSKKIASRGSKKRKL